MYTVNMGSLGYINAKDDNHSGKFANDARRINKDDEQKRTVNARIAGYWDNGKKKVCIKTNVEIKANEEVYIDYGADYWQYHGVIDDELTQSDSSQNSVKIVNPEDNERKHENKRSADEAAQMEIDDGDDILPGDIMHTVTKEDVIEHQKNDPRVKDIRKNMDDPTHKSFERLHKYYIEHDKLLWLKPANEQGKKRLLVPMNLRTRILYQHHGAPLSAHPGRNKVTKAISEKYYWPKMTEDIKKWLKACLACQRRKAPRPMNAGARTPIIRTKPFQLIGMDFYGPLPDTVNGNKYILTMIDVFTRWPIAVAVPDRKSSTVARAIYEQLISVHGCPKAILTDRGKEFLAAGIKKLCRTMGIAKIETTGFQPQANGHVERFHQWIGRMMTMMSNEKKDDWDLYLDASLFAYRISTNESTGFTPFELVYGRQATVPLDLLWKEVESEVDDNSKHTVYADEIRTRLKATFEKVRETQMKAANANINRRRTFKEVKFNIGDQVLVWGPEKVEKYYVPKKFQYRHSVPGTIVGKESDKLYLVDRPDRKGDEKVRKVNVNRLSLYTPWEDYIVSHGTLQRLKDPIDIAIEQTPLPARRKPKIGDLVITIQGNSNEAFRVAKVLDERRDGTLKLHWYGNIELQENSTYNPGWIDNNDRNKCYFRPKPKRSTHDAYTSVTSNESLSHDAVIYSGFQLTSKHRIPPDVLEVIEQSDKTSWEREL